MKHSLQLSLTLLLALFGIWDHTGGAIAQDTVGSSVAQAPPLAIPNKMEFYPAKAKQLGLTGRVGLECSIDMNGHAQNIAVVEPSGSLLDNQAVQLLSIGHFNLPDDWAVTAGPETRYRIGFTFELTNKPPVPQFQDGRTTIKVRGSGIP